MNSAAEAALHLSPAQNTGNENTSARDRLIVALDYPDSVSALAAVDRLSGLCGWFKVGLELYLAAGNGIVETLRRRGFSVFLDLKLHDIPNTVAGAVRSATICGADMLTVHASGGPAMLAAAAEAASTPHAPKLLAVTVLTSMDQQQLAATGVTDPPASQVLRLAQMAWGSGIRGFVASAEELPALRSHLPKATLVIPGIRPAGAAIGDQKRVATPAAAIAAGAGFLVVGRPITQAPDPAQAAEAILGEIASAISNP
ncbi:orotidine-5'-phosphate decarboxylase [Paracidobacterium acidisoli]|uniref:Orotidine 5'-phosphate decarboxylase n=1 Tax=Paracidobacterium acidisoli TaxID=2303751 RepID=A0A372IS46_9BACT|nr:orotidine-5'-phosphate decarboxylase [Paracidobacterium acidisoli]MBT9330663.1 orotidine-5'-phosphate decarboxylase [Paracidobacterium acidisoli]